MNRKLVVGLLIVMGLAIVLFFGFRLARAFRNGGFPPHPQSMATTTDVALIREWMTIPYIAQIYGLPDRALFDALEIPRKENHRKSLTEINDEYFPGQDGLVLARVQQTILAFQAHKPLPPMPPTP